MIRMDREVGSYMLDLYSKNWTQKIHRPENLATNSFEDYMKKRLWDVGVKYLCKFLSFEISPLILGIRPLFAILEFASGYRLTPYERQLTDRFLELLEKVAALMNDYYSYDREAFMNRTEGVRIFNSVNFFMEHESLSVEDAKSKVRGLIVGLEQQYLREKQEIYRDYPNLSHDHKCYIEHCEASIGGAHYWCAIADRYNYWKKMPGAFPYGEAAIEDGAEKSSPELNGTDHHFANTGKETPIPNGTKDLSNGTATPQGKRKCDPSNAFQNGTSEKKQKLLHDKKTVEETIRKLDDSVILAPSNYIQSLPSKGVRRILIESFNEWFDVPKQSQDIIKMIVDLLHNASLMLDDCEDRSELRRGSPATHTIFGQAQTINTATFLFVHAVQEAGKLQNARSLDALLDQLKVLFVGQSWDLHWREKYICPTEEEYLEMIDHKTGGLFRLLADLMQLESTTPYHYDLDILVKLLGRYFQVRDDFVNLMSKDYSEQKGFCEDLAEGKISYCVVICAQKDPARADQIMGIFRQQALSSQGSLQRQTKEYILKLLEEAGALEATKTKLGDLEISIDDEIARLEGVAGIENPLLKMVVEMLRNK